MLLVFRCSGCSRRSSYFSSLGSFFYLGKLKRGRARWASGTRGTYILRTVFSWADSSDHLLSPLSLPAAFPSFLPVVSLRFSGTDDPQ